MHQTSSLCHGRPYAAKSDPRAGRDIQSQAGLRVEWLDNTNTSQLVPWLKLPGNSSIIFMPEDGFLDGYTLARGYIQAARKLMWRFVNKLPS